MLSCESFGNSSISMGNVIVFYKSLFYKSLTRKTTYFEQWSCFKFNNLGLALGMDLKFDTNMTKDLK